MQISYGILNALIVFLCLSGVIIILIGIFANALEVETTREERNLNHRLEYVDRHMQDSVFYKEANTDNCYMISGVMQSITVVPVSCEGIVNLREFTAKNY